MSLYRSVKSKVILFTLAAILPLGALLSVQPVGAVYATNINAGDLNSLSNQERANNGLAQLTLNSQLSSAAYAKATDMFADNYWAHVAPDGTTPWNFILASGYDYTTAGENLANGFSTSSGVIAGWMASPGHRANVLNSAYKDVGYAVMNGTLLGSQTTLVVAMYGVTNAITTPISSPEPAPAPVTQVETPTTQAPAPTTTILTPVTTQPAPVNTEPVVTPVSTPTAPVVTTNPVTSPVKTQPVTKERQTVKKYVSLTSRGTVAGATTLLSSNKYFGNNMLKIFGYKINNSNTDYVLYLI